MNCQKTLKQNELGRWCEQISQGIQPKTVFLLSGSLGAGKTLFVEKMVAALGGGSVSSPTYSLINSYSSHEFANIYHVDLYRLENQDEIESVGFWDLFAQEQAIIFVEWPERINIKEIPIDWVTRSIKITKSLDDSTRDYTIF